MAGLWLTYAWADNDDGDVDHVIAELERHDVPVRYDRLQIRAGERLWSKIDRSISDPDLTTAWAIFVTKSSIQSEACQEELAYALDRALRERGDFPIIGIFSEPLDRKLIPSAIAIRKYVSLRDPNWASEVKRSLDGGTFEPPKINPFSIRIYRNARTIFEVRPRTGRWYPFVAALPASEKHLLDSVYSGPAGALPSAAMSAVREIELNHGEFSGIELGSAIDAHVSAFVQLTGMPTRMVFGQTPQTFLLETKNIDPAWYV